MNKLLSVFSLCLLLSEFAPAGTVGSAQNDVPFSAGFACEDITPEPGILMPGYFQRREMSGALDPLEASCLALSDGERTAFVLVADNVRLSEAVMAEARVRITEQTGVPAEGMFFHSSHIHTGGDVFPDKPSCLEMHPETPTDKARMRAYAALVVERLTRAAVRAKADLAAATIRMGRAQCPRHAFVRRFRMKDGSTRTNPGVGNPNIAAPLGEPDDTVQVVRFVRAGRKEITLLNFQNHPDVVGGTKVSADWPGVARRTLVKALDGATECLLINGAMGDLNHVIVDPRPGETLRKGYENAQHLGQMVAGAALLVWGRCAPVPAGRLSFGIKNVLTPANKGRPEDLPLAHRYWDLHCANRDVEIPSSGMDKTLLIADARRKVRLEHAPDRLTLPLTALVIGDSLALAGIPGQPFVQIGRDIKQRAPFKMTIISSITNAGLGYFPTQDAFVDGGYEAKTSDFTGQVAADVTEGTLSLLESLKTGHVSSAPVTMIAVANAGFEDQTDGKVMAWRLPPEMQVVRGVGHNGSAGLVWKSSSPSTRRVAASQTFPIAPGKAYHFSALMRATDFVGRKGAKIDASVLDANGKVLCEHYPRGIKSSTDWMRVDGLVDAPPSAAKMRLLLSVLPGSSGEVAFDDILVEPKELEVAAFAFSSGYRDEMVAGPVTFTGFIRLPAKQTVDTIRAAFVCRGADGAERRLPAALSVEADEVYATAQTETALLAEGAQQIRFVVVEQSGKVLGESDFTFRRVSALPKRRVGIDAHGRCLVNGEPFFPIGMYSHKLSEADAAAYATGPFNSIVVYGLSDRDDLARLAKHGIWYVPTLKNELVGRKQAVERGIRTVAESDAFFRSEIAKLKDAPNLLGWYVCDEAPLTELEARRRLYALYRQCDDDHPCWAVMDKLERIREWVAICDVYGVDPYPICGRPMARITDFCAGVRRSTRGGRAFWNVPQNFNWAWYGRAETQGVANRMPTTEEMAFINWCHIASGANGLFGYTFAAIRQEEAKGRGKFADFQKHWQSICAAYADVKRLAPVLLSVEPTPPPPTVATETPVRLWRKDGNLYVLACNASDATRTLSVTLGGYTHLEGIELGNAVSVRVAEGKLLFELPSVGYSMARLKMECQSR